MKNGGNHTIIGAADKGKSDRNSCKYAKIYIPAKQPESRVAVLLRAFRLLFSAWWRVFVKFCRPVFQAA
jgi:hypothetical protein